MSGYATNVQYHPNGAVKQFTYGNGIVHEATPNDRQLPAHRCDAFGATEFLDDYYDYDQNGNVAAITDDRALSGGVGDRDMAYDDLDRLTSVHSPMYSAIGDGTARYWYDALDNLTRVVAPGRDHWYCHDASNRLTNVKTGGCGGATVIGLGYDVQGNLRNRSGDTYDFDYGNRLRGATVGGAAATYVYDGLGRRVRDTVAGAGLKYSLYGRDGRLLWSQDHRKREQQWHVFLGGQLVAIRKRNMDTGAIAYHYQHTDALGSTVAVTDASRLPVDQTQYEPYGQPLDGHFDDLPGYTGHVMDGAAQLIYMQQRYYDPAIGMFLSVDPVTAHSDPVGQFHRYRYANNNPYKFTDPDGRCAASRLQAVCAMGATMFNSLGMAAQATFRQTQMVRPVNGANSTPEQAAVQFGNDTQQEAADTQREPQAGIVQTGESSYQYTKPMWGGEGQRIVDVSEYTEALTYVYGASAVGFAHGHWDTNPLFTRHDVGIFQQEPDFPFTVFMHNQAGQTRKMSSSIFRSELRRGRRDGLRTFEDYLRVHSGMEGVCIAGC